MFEERLSTIERMHRRDEERRRLGGAVPAFVKPRPAPGPEQLAEAERQRQADEQARIEREAKAREADKAHKKTVNNEALAALVAGGMPEECAKQAITLIAQRRIPHISINY